MVLVATTGIVAISGTPASASSCSHSATDKQTTSGQVVLAGSTGLAVRSGPHTSCTLLGRVPNGHWVTYWCHTAGDTVNGTNRWVRIDYSAGGGSGVLGGWVSSYYLNTASTQAC
ncbi:SH3 domain-containing protein [Micromonospora sp. CP22]|uniref:SH3 domain-containing protein n=1 Tax=Micromonospora sp. CP22 TaxID=2580517 RepID=UPI0035C8C7CE